jgi:alpha-tubulin suppressor-like RCC1 family protein
MRRLFWTDHGSVPADPHNRGAYLGRRTARALAVLLLGVATAGGCQDGPQGPQPTTSVWAWGFNDVGQIGDGGKVGHSEPIRLSLSDVTQIAAGFHSSLARKSDGSVWQWGSLDKQVPTSTPCMDPTVASGSIACDLTPTRFSNLAKAKSIGAGYDFAFAIIDDSNSSLCRWGENSVGQLGNAFLDPVAAPVCSFPDRVLYADGGGGGRFRGGHTVAISSGPPQITVWSWGRNEHKQVGSVFGICGPLDCVSLPARVNGLVDVIGAAAGHEHSLALKIDGSVWSWGNQDFGQLGVPGANGDTGSPVRVWMSGTSPPSYLDGVSDIAAGGEHSLAIRKKKDDSGKEIGTVWAWGYNNFGQIGKPINSSNAPVQLFARQVPGLTDIVQIAAGDDFSLALKSDGTVWAWGRNDRGQLGATSSDKCGPQQLPCSVSPIQVRNLTGVTSIAAGGAHSLALVRA